jgi:cobalt-zinc-cadmium efflux system outer membrane protein
MRFGAICIGLVAIALAIGCGALPTARSHGLRRPLPAALSTEDSGPLPDPREAGPVALGVLLRYAALHAPRLIEARARLAIGWAELEGSSAPILQAPELEMSAGVRRPTSDPGLDASISIRQPFEISGARGARIAAAELGALSTRAELAAVEWEVHRVVHAAFHDAQVAREFAAVALRAAEFHARVADVARQRLQAGEISMLDLRVAEGEAAEAAQESAAAAGRYRASRVTLALESGWPPERAPEPRGALEPPHDPPALGGLVRRALSEQAILRRALIEIDHAEAHVRLADREAWPLASLGVSYAREVSEDVVQGLFGMGFPLFATNQAERARARAEVTVARANLEALRSVIPALVTRAHLAVATAVERVRAYGTEILPRFEESLALLSRALELGEIDVVELSVASGRFLAVQREALEASADYHRALADLEAAVGAELEIPDGGTQP